ncbi:MAG: exo-alpha-sialidase [Flavobacterium sp.]|nr:exo-alpha-sialidase [Pedobacter sp.]
MKIIYNLALLWYIPIISGLLFQFSIACNQVLEIPQASLLADSLQKQTRDEAGVANIVFKSADGGQTWQDISEGLPENFREDDVQRDGFFANDNGFYLRTDDGLYHSQRNSTVPFWIKEIFPGQQSRIAPGRTGILAYNYEGQFLQKINGTGTWSPAYTNFREKEIRTVFETAGGSVFIGCNRGLFRSTNSGKTWKQVQAGGWAMKLVESNGILLATSQRGIIRSADEGENWEAVISEGGVGIAVEIIQGGFAAITFNTQSRTRRVRTSYDGGKTWQPIDAGLQEQANIARFNKPLSQVGSSDSIWHPINTAPLPDQAFITSIIQVGENFFCGHPTGVFRSSDKGKTWKLILPSVENKVFNLSVSGNVIYAIPRNGGC